MSTDAIIESKYAAERGPAYDPGAAALQEMISNVEAEDSTTQKPQAPSFDVEKKPSVAGEIVTQAAGGGLEAVQEFGNCVLDLADWAENTAAKYGYGNGTIIPDKWRLEFADRLVPESDKWYGRLTRNMTQFLLPYAGITKVAGAAAGASKLMKFSRAALTGAAVDFAAFDPHEKRLANFLKEHTEVRLPMIEYLAADPNDSGVEGRFKNALEGIGLGIATEAGMGLFRLAKAYRANRTARAAADVVDSTAPKAGAQTATQAELQGSGGATAEMAPGMQKPPTPTGAARPEGMPALPNGATASGPGAAPNAKVNPAEPIGPAPNAKVTPPPLSTPKEAVEFLPAGGGFKINFSAIGPETDLDQAVKNIAKRMQSDANITKRGIQPDDARNRLAEMLNITPEKLSQRPIGQAFNDYQTKATGDFLVGVTRSVEDLAKAASGPQATREAKAIFVEALDNMRVVYAHFMGIRAEAGRALRTYRALDGARSAAAKAQTIADLIATSGGEGNIDEMTKAILGLGKKSDIEMTKSMGKWVRRSWGENAYDAMMTIRVNGLLSGIKTHVKNIIGNTVATIDKPLSVGAGRVASKIRGADKALSVDPSQFDGVAEGEFFSTVTGLVEGFMDGLRTASKTLFSGVPDERFVPRLVGADTTKALFSKANLGNSAKMARNLQELGVSGWASDFLAFVSTLSNRALSAEDDFFKAIHYRMELNRQATRDGVMKGLSGDEFAKNYNNVISGANDDLKLASIEEARYNTFTKPLANTFGKISETISGNKYLRVVFPFVNTNLNILEYTIERTPVLRRALKKVQSDLARPGVKRDMAQGRVALGTMTLGGFAALAASGYITGNGTDNVTARNIKTASGWRPNSVFIGGKYYAYDRGNPLGQMIGMAADMAELGGVLYDQSPDDYMQLGLAAGAIVAEYMAPDLLIRGGGELYEAITGDEKAALRFIKSEAASFIPAAGIMRDVRKEVDTLKRDTHGQTANDLWGAVFSEAMNTVPGVSKYLPVSRNIFGEPIAYDPGFGPDLVSPVYTSEQKTDDPVISEIVRLSLAGPFAKTKRQPGQSQISINLPPRQIIYPGTTAPVEFTPLQYERFVILSAGFELRGYKRTLKEELDFRISKFKQKDSDEARRLEIRSIINGYRKSAMMQMLKEDSELSNTVNAMYDIRTENLTKPGGPQ